MKRLTVSILALVTLGVVTACGEDQRAVVCRNSGGFTRDSTMTTTGITTKGSIAFSTLTIRYCFRNGNIVDIWQA